MSIFKTIGKALMTPITGTIGAALGAVGLNTLGSYIGAKQQQDFNAREAAKQRAWQEEMWNKQNAYNDPSAQMARLDKAGLNPNLVYGDGATTLAAQVGSGAHASSQQAKYNLDVVSMLQQLRSQNEQIKNVAQDTKVKEKQEMLVNDQVHKTRAEVNKIYQDMDESEARVALFTSQRALADANIKMQDFLNSIVAADGMYDVAVKKMKDEGAITGYQADTLRKNYEVLDQKLKYELDKMFQEIENLKKQGKLIDANAVQSYAAATNLRAMAKFYSASAELSQVQRSYYEKLLSKTDAEISKITSDIFLNAIQGRVDILKAYQSAFGSDMISQLIKTLFTQIGSDNGIIHSTGNAYDNIEHIDNLFKEFNK